MTQDNGDDRRTETRRFTSGDAPFGADDLIEGDRIDPALVGRTMAGLGTRRSADPDTAETQLAEATITHRLDDIHRAILVDGETGVMLRATRHDRQQAWTQREADWKVRGRGDRVSITAAGVKQGDLGGLGGEADGDATESWANVVLQDRARGRTDYSDELRLTTSTTLRLRDGYDEVEVSAEIELVETEAEADE